MTTHLQIAVQVFAIAAAVAYAWWFTWDHRGTEGARHVLGRNPVPLTPTQEAAARAAESLARIGEQMAALAAATRKATVSVDAFHRAWIAPDVPGRALTHRRTR